MNKQFLLLIFCLLGSLPGFSQNIVVPEILRWDSSAYENGSSLLYRDTSLLLIGAERGVGSFIAQLDDSLKIISKQYFNPNLGIAAAKYALGSYYLGGTRSVNANTRTLAMSRVNLAGFSESTARANLEGSFDYAVGATPTNDSGVVVFGMGSPIRVTNLCKFDRSGSILWNKKFALSSDSYANDVLESPNGDLYVTGSSVGDQTTIRGAFLLKLNNQGDSLWTKGFSNGSGTGYRLFQTNDHQILIIGSTRDTSITNKVNIIFYLAKVDTLGELVWEQEHNWFQADSVVNMLTFNDAARTSDGGVVFLATVGILSSKLQGEYPYLLKTDAQGQYQWHKVIILPSGTNARGRKVLPLKNGTYGLLLAARPAGADPYTVYALLGPDGTFTEVDAAREALAFTASPNPATDRVELSWTQVTSGEAEIRLLDVQGRLLTRSSAMHAAGSARSEISLSAFPDGIYFVEIISGGKQGSMKLVKR
ncbi:MAG: T9SS type A sorting domain-containing protein [Bacteroidia bacterium]|nr:T9SS type A sorting domain-containing protein [Bacteroidia bacterium]